MLRLYLTRAASFYANLTKFSPSLRLLGFLLLAYS